MATTAEAIRAALNFFKDRKRAYQMVFSGPAGAEVLEDMATFCRANKTCVVPGDPDLTKHLEGRREAFLRIQEHLCWTPEQMLHFYTNLDKQKETAS